MTLGYLSMKANMPFYTKWSINMDWTTVINSAGNKSIMGE